MQLGNWQDTATTPQRCTGKPCANAYATSEQCRQEDSYLSPPVTGMERTKTKFKIHGWSDSNYATDLDCRRSIMGTVVYLNDAPIVFSSVMHKHLTLSVTEAELVAVMTMVQGMMYIYRVITSIGLQVELPMTAEMDNSGVGDLANSWSIVGRTRHMDVRMCFLCKLKEEGMVVYKHIPGPDIEEDIFTKNVC